MLRRFYAAILILVTFILDSTLMPIIYDGVFAVPLTVVAVLLIGMLLGRMRGLLYGTIGGLLLDITTGTLGMMTFFMMAAGFLIGLILYAPGERFLPSRRRQRRRVLWQAGWVFSLYLVGEIAFFLIQYFNTARIVPITFLHMLVRALICTALTMLFKPLMERVLVDRGENRFLSRNREVKSF